MNTSSLPSGRSRRRIYHSIPHMSRLISAILVALVLGFSQTGCQHAELWNQLPANISSFITQYFPSSELESVTHSAANYHVRIANGPGMTFGSDGAWIDIDGYGMPLPQVLLFDQLPPRMYEYLQETEQLNSVFALTREDGVYTATLMNSTLTYDVETGMLKGSDPS